jgi:Secretion system C-terminal sorting domain
MNYKTFLIVVILIGLVSNIFPQTLFRSGIILHHSSGGVIWSSSSPNVPQLMTNYNTQCGYTGNNAVTMNLDESFFPSINNGGNFYDTWHAVFVGESAYPEEDIELQQYIQNNRIVVIKSCWGGSGIAPMGNPADTLIIDDEASTTGRTYYRTQWHWRSIIKVMQSYPDNFFVIWTGIPLVPGPSYDGTLAHRFFTWAKDTLAKGNDPIFGDFPDNVYVFDAFHLLATPTENFWWGTAYWGMNPLYHDEGDNHPNELGDDVVAPPFVEETFGAAILYEEDYNLPVELSAFSAAIIGSSIQLNWRTETEVNNYGFEVERKINNWEKIGFVQGNGNSNSPKNYSFIDKNLTKEKYFYRLKQIDNDGQFEYSKVIEIDFNPITTYTLDQNYPNPFNPSTVIEFSLPENVGNVELSIYNALGEKLAELVNTVLTAGKYQYEWNAQNIAAGMYIYELKTNNFVSVKKMILMK